MGCCISSNNGGPGLASKEHKHVGSDEASSQLKKGFSHESRAPPPPPSIDQEETVKEVLSETPKPKPKPNPDPEPIFTSLMKQDLQQQQQEEEKEAKISASPRKVEAFAKNTQDKQNLSSSNEEEIMSQVSEICSVSESLSTMTNVTDTRDVEEGEQELRQRQRVITRSPAKPPPRNGFKRDRVVNESPTRRPDQSPARRIGRGSSVQIHDSDRVKCPGRRDPGEGYGGRSRSPASTTRSSAPTSFMGRSPSARRTNRSPGRARSVPIENTTTGTSSINNNNNNNNSNSSSSRTMEGKWASHNNNDHCSSANESLENPLVSLECFIFL